MKHNIKTHSTGCSIEGCSRKHEARGFCKPHYKQFMKHGDPLYRSPAKPKVNAGECSVHDCKTPAKSKGMCAKHYSRVKNHGSTDKPKRVKRVMPSGEKHWSFKDLTGERFGRLVVQKYTGKKTVHNKLLWECLCDCGAISITTGGDLRKGDTKSCGCLAREVVTKHGLSGTRTAKSFDMAKQRCTNPHNNRFRWYGGAGVEFKFSDYQHLVDHIGIRPEGTTLGRYCDSGNYEEGNIAWMSDTEQHLHKKLRQALDGLNINYHTDGTPHTIMRDHRRAA